MTSAGKAVLVTGANRGIGRALADEALRRGARVVYAGTRRPFTHPDARVTPLTLTQSLRALLAGQWVSVHAVLTGPTDTDMTRGFDIPKASAESVAHAVFDGLEHAEARGGTGSQGGPRGRKGARPPGWHDAGTAAARALTASRAARAPGPG